MSMEPDWSPHPRYRILEQIGKGGMGEVFSAEDRLTSQVVALKKVRLPQQTVEPALHPLGTGAASLGLAGTLAAQQGLVAAREIGRASCRERV